MQEHESQDCHSGDPVADKHVDDSVHVCPMHPHERQDGPGDCAACGMALEPLVPRPSARAEWTCPMHPEIVRDGPGDCPVCGMALEPRTPVSERDQGSAELREMSRRLWPPPS